MLEYWARVRAGVEPAPRPGAEAKRNKRLCAHLESHLDDVLAHAGAGGADEGRSRLANEAATALEVGEHLAHDDVMELKRRAREQRGEALSAREVARLKSLGAGKMRREASTGASYAIARGAGGRRRASSRSSRRSTTTVESFLNTDAVNYRGTCAIGTNRRRASTAPSSKISPRRARRRKSRRARSTRR